MVRIMDQILEVSSESGLETSINLGHFISRDLMESLISHQQNVKEMDDLWDL